MGYDIVGYDDDYDDVDEVLSGYDIVGASPLQQMWMNRRTGGLAPRPGVRAPVKVAPARQYATVAPLAGRSQGSMIRNQVPTKSRRTILPIESATAIAAGVTSNVTARPQDLAFKPERLIIPSTIAPDFLIVDIKVGNRSQFTQSGNVPGEAFIPNSDDAMVDFDTLQTSQDFVMIVQNISGASRTFRAALFGHALQQ
jgi:hypothetical protein